MSRDENRPYPDGIAWDEAYRQRNRADAAEESRDKLADIVRRLAEWAESDLMGDFDKIASDAVVLWAEMQAKGGGE